MIIPELLLKYDAITIQGFCFHLGSTNTIGNVV